METVMIATKNAGKAKEFAELFRPFGMKVQSLLDIPESIDVEETGTTFIENARLKAETIAKQYQLPVIADDSGLVIDALDGRPGVYSARYAGLDKNDEANIDKVLKELDGVSLAERTARFKCVLATVVPDGDSLDVSWFEGTCDGLIGKERVGRHGFGYDPIFYIPSEEKTMAELTKDEKNRVSHRGKALQKLMQGWSYLEES